MRSKTGIRSLNGFKIIILGKIIRMADKKKDNQSMTKIKWMNKRKLAVDSSKRLINRAIVSVKKDIKSWKELRIARRKNAFRIV